MPDKIIVYWRDIPSQVIIKRGRNKGKMVLSQRFQVAIDDAAMRSGKAGTDDYVEEWRRISEPCDNADDIQAQAASEAELLETAYPDERLKSLVAAGGLDEGSA